MTAADAAATDWAQNVAPRPDAAPLFNPAIVAPRLAGDLAAHHAAMAWGYHLAIEANPDTAVGWAMAPMLLHYEIAHVWYYLACGTEFDEEACGAGMAREVLTDLVSPHVIAPNIAGLLEWANVDHARILAFRAPKGGAA